MRIKKYNEYVKTQWKDLTKDVSWFKDSPIQRAGYNGIKRNINFAFPEKKNMTAKNPQLLFQIIMNFGFLVSNLVLDCSKVILVPYTNI